MTIIVQATAEWSSFKQRYETLATAATASYQQVEPLVRYLEAECIRVPAMLLAHKRRYITADYQKMKATLGELATFMQRATKMIADGLID